MATGAGRGDGMHLVVPAKTESIAIARQLVAGIGDALDLDEFEVADLKLVISEACSNTVRHAYPRDVEAEGVAALGPIDISVAADDRVVAIIVRDNGFGFALAAPNEESLGLGIPLMASVSERLELRAREEGGVELCAEIAIGDRRRDRRERTRPDAEALAGPAGLDGEVARMTLQGELALKPILARLIGICALRTGLTIDQLADTLIVSDAVAAGDVWAEETQVTLIEEPSYAKLTIGPLANGGGQRLIEGLEIPGVGSVANLASEISIEDRPAADPAGEYMTMAITGPDRS